MKKIFFLAICSFLSIAAFSQQDPLKEVKLSMFGNKKDYAKSKQSIDKVMADPKFANNAEAWYWKSYIYNYLPKDPKTSGLCTDCRGEAFEAMKKYLELDPTMKETKSDSNAVIFDMYYGYYQQAVDAYNNKQYDSALTNFKNAIKVEEYIAGKNLPGPNGAKAMVFDTTAILYAGVAAAQVKKDDESVALYRRLIDAGVNDPQYQEIYESVADHYKKKGDQASMNDVIAKGKKAYPTNDYWYQIETEALAKLDDKKPLFDAYERQIKDMSSSFFITYNYSIELFRYVYNGGDTKIPDAAQKKARLTEVINMAMATKGDSTMEGTVLMAKHLDYYSADLTDAANAIKGVKPEDTKKKNELKADANKKTEESVTYALKAADYFSKINGKLTGRQKSNYRDMLTILSNYYQFKKDDKKAQEYKQKKTDLDKS